MTHPDDDLLPIDPLELEPPGVYEAKCRTVGTRGFCVYAVGLDGQCLAFRVVQTRGEYRRAYDEMGSVLSDYFAAGDDATAAMAQMVSRAVAGAGRPHPRLERPPTASPA